MRDVLPIVIIVIAVLLVLVVLITLKVWRKQKGGFWRDLISPGWNWNMKAFLVQWIIGLTIALIGALLMFDGDILGEKTIGNAWLVGSIGLAIALSSFLRLLP